MNHPPTAVGGISELNSQLYVGRILSIHPLPWVGFALFVQGPAILELVNSETGILRLYLIRGNLYAATRAGWPEARHQYQRAIEILAKLKAEKEIGLPDLRNLVEAQQKLQAISQ